MKLYVILFLVVILESLVTTLPLVWITLLLGYILLRRQLYVHALIAGAVLDLFSVSPLFSRGILLLLMLLLVSLYERKFEIATIPFVVLSSYIGSVVFLFIFHYNEILIQSLVVTFLAIGIYRIVILSETKNLRDPSLRSG